MDLRDLETFVVVAEELHFGRAAQRLHIVPAAVTQRIQALEQDFGVQLFHRTTRRVELTAQGLRLVEATRESLRSVEELRGLALELSGRVAARLSIAVGPDLGAFLAPVLAELSAVVPDLRPTGASMWSSEASAAVQEGAADGAIVRAPVLRSGLEESPIGTSIDTAVAVSEADPISRLRTPITREDLRDSSVLIPDRAVAPGPHDQIVEYFADAGVEPRWRLHRMQSYELLLPLVAISRAVVLVHDHVTTPPPTGVVLRPLQHPGARSPVVLVTRSGDRSIAVSALRAVVLARRDLET